MADIIVDVSLPSPITTDVTSPTQALATNVSVPGPENNSYLDDGSGLNTGSIQFLYPFLNLS